MLLRDFVDVCRLLRGGLGLSPALFGGVRGQGSDVELTVFILEPEVARFFSDELGRNGLPQVDVVHEVVFIVAAAVVAAFGAVIGGGGGEAGAVLGKEVIGDDGEGGGV